MPHFLSWRILFCNVHEESIRPLKKWGLQTHGSFEWLTYTAEELGSLAKAISEWEYRGGPPEKVVAEAIHVATLSLKIAEMFMAGADPKTEWKESSLDIKSD